MLSPDAAVALAAVRGREMAAACALEPTGMSAVLGGNPDEVLARLEELGLDPANRNGAGQIVAAGPRDALARLAENPPARARVMPLAVAGAFHTRFMAPAEQALGEHAASVTPADPATTLLSNADGAAVSDGADALRRLVAQVTRPVRWDACQATLRELGVTALIELPPAGTLVGLARRELKGVRTLALKTPTTWMPPRNWCRRRTAAAQTPWERRDERPGCGSPRACPVPGCSGWAASSRTGSSPTTSSPPASTPTTSGSAPGSASRAGASRTRTRIWSTWPPTRAPAR